MIDLAADSLTGHEVCAILSKIRNGETWKYSQAPMWIINIILPDIGRMVKWIDSGKMFVDVAASRALYPDLMTMEQWMVKRGYATKQFEKPSSCVIS